MSTVDVQDFMINIYINHIIYILMMFITVKYYVSGMIDSIHLIFIINSITRILFPPLRNTKLFSKIKYLFLGSLLKSTQNS